MVKVSNNGTIVIPTAVRTALGIEAGNHLSIFVRKKGKSFFVVLKKVVERKDDFEF